MFIDMRTILLALLMMATTMTACGQGSDETAQAPSRAESTKTYKVKLTFGNNQSLTATLDDNATTRAIIAKMPMTLPSLDLYGDEICYRFTEALPTDNVEYYLHKKGEIFYWPPGHSLVIRYIETDEWLDIQHIGQVDSGVDVLNGIGNIDITWELVEETTAVVSPKAENSKADDAVYALNGQRVGSSLDGMPRGIYIKGGKKIIR